MPTPTLVRAVQLEPVFVLTVSDLTGFSGTATSLMWTDVDRGGQFFYAASGYVTDNGTVFTATGKGSGFWVRQYNQTDGVHAKWFGANGDGTTDNTAVFTTLTAFKNIFIAEGTYAMASDITFPAGIMFTFANNAKLKPASTKTITFNADLTDTMNQIFDLTAGGKIAGLRNLDFVRPEWWGAKADCVISTLTGTDSSIGFQAAIEHIEREKLSVLQVSSGRYLFSSKVILRKGGYIIRGSGGLSNPILLTNFITGANGLDTLFDYGNDEATNASNTMSFWGVLFYSKSVTTGVQRAIKHTQNNNGPHRNFYIEHCGFVGFAKAIHFICATPGNVVAANVNITKCVVSGNTYGVYSDSIVLGFRYEDNFSENGGKIYGDFEAGVSIKYNMLEGQDDTIFLTGGAAQVEIGGNYFEANNGDYIVKLQYTGTPAVAPTSFVVFPNHFGGNNPDGPNGVVNFLDIKGVRNFTTLAGGNTEKFLTISGTTGDTINLDGGGFLVPNPLPSSVANIAVVLDPIDYVDGILLEGATYQKLKVGTTNRDTTIGEKRMLFATTVTSNFTPTVPITYAIGDVFIVNIIMQKTDTTETVEPMVELLNNVGVAVARSIASTVKSNKGTDMLITFVVQTITSEAVGAKFRFSGYNISGTGSGVYISDAEIFKVTPGVSDTRVICRPYISFDTQVYTVATLPTAVQGDRAIVTDALLPTYGAIVAGGGAVVTSVFGNGTNWIVG